MNHERDGRVSRRFLTAACFTAALVLTGSARAAVPTGPPVFSDPLTFTNRFQPFQPGGLKIYTGRKDGETSLIADLYLKETRTFMAGGRPVEARVLEETEFSGGALIEISRNFFAQADDGSVYYFGELVDEFDGGVVVGHDGSWLVGGATDPNDPVVTADAPDPTLFMPANPEAGDVFKQEDLAPVVDETDTVVATDQMVNTIGGRFTGAIRVLETTVLGDPPETKWYAPGVGAVRGRTKHEEFVLSASTLIP